MTTDAPYDSPADQPPPYAQQPPKSNRPAWLIPLILLLVATPLLLCCGCFACFGGVLYGALKPVHDAALEVVSSDPTVQRKLGTPVESVMPFNINVENRDAKVDMNVKGPNGTATVKGDMVKTGENWQAKSLTVTFDDGTSVILP